jgi:hypothetical protein
MTDSAANAELAQLDNGSNQFIEIILAHFT